MAISALFGGGIIFAPVGSATATVAPPIALRYFAAPVTFPDGSLLADTAIAGGGTPTGGATLQGVATDGTASWNVPYQDQETVWPPPVADNAGQHYWVDSQQATGVRLIASHGASEVWAKSLALDSVQNMAVGTDGNLYTWQGNGLNGYSAKDGHALFPPISLTSFTASADQLFAYNGGLIVAAANQTQYFDYSGHSVAGPYALTASATAFSAFAAQPNGDLFATGMTAGVPFGGCSSPGVDALLEKVTPSGGSTWVKTLPWHSRCNWYGQMVSAMPDGGVVVSSATDTGHGSYQYVDRTGTVGWYSETTGPAITGGSLQPLPPRIDTNGNIVAEGSFGFACNLRSDDCLGAQIDRLGSNGNSVGSPIVLQGPTDINQESWATMGGLALVPGRVYASLNHITGGRIFGTPDYGLYQFDMPGLGAEYPQSVLWKLMPTTTAPAHTASLALTPATDSSPVNVTHTLTALLKRDGVPVSGGTIDFTVSAGPCKGKAATLSTDDTGTAAWGYACGLAGTDTVTATASVSDGAGGLVTASAATASVTWQASPPAGRIGAWGDSYISGEGAPDPNLGFLLGTDQPGNHCHRSSDSYAALIAAKKHLGLDFHACSGAIVQDFYTPFSQNHPGEGAGELPQIETVSSKDTIGLLGIDGNNALFPEVMSYCSTRQFGQKSCEAVYGKAVTKRLAAIAASPTLPSLYRDVHQRMAPGAKLYVIGYPRFFPVNPPAACNTGVFGLPIPKFSKSDMLWINKQIAALDSINKRAAAAAAVKFIDVYDVFKGHEICNTLGNKDWMNRAIPKLKISWSFHPNVAGHYAESLWIAARMN
jgi:hypothetical protein